MCAQTVRVALLVCVSVLGLPTTISLRPLLKWRFAPITMKPCRDQTAALTHLSNICEHLETSTNTLTLWYSTTSSMKSIPSARGIRTPLLVQSEVGNRICESSFKDLRSRMRIRVLLLIRGTTDICSMVFRGACRGISCRQMKKCHRGFRTVSKRWNVN